MLVVTLAPKPTESLFGYAIRLSERNGYPTPSVVLSYAGYGHGRTLRFNMDTNALAGIVGRSTAELERIAYSDSNSAKGRLKILDHSLGTVRSHGLLTSGQKSLCPACVDERGFISAFWDITAAVACPTHKCVALQQCPHCEQQINWLRPGMLTCRCLGSLGSHSRPTAPGHLVAFMQVLWDKLHAVSRKESDNPFGFPLREIDELSLRDFLSITSLLGQFEKGDRTPTRSAAPARTVSFAATVLADWPNGYHRFLKDLGDTYRKNGTRAIGLRKQFSPFYEAMFKSKILGKRAEFMRKEFVNFGAQKWGQAVLDKKLFRDGDGTNGERFASIQSAAKRYNISPTTLSKWCKQGLVPHKEIKTAEQSRFVIDTDAVSELSKSPGKTMPEREAAALAGLPVSVLNGLRQSGHYRSKHSPKFKHGYHEKDIQALRRRLLTASVDMPEVTIDGQQHVSLREILMTKKFWSNVEKSRFVSDYLDGTIQSVGRVTPSIRSIYFDRADVDAYVKAAHEEMARGVLTFREAAATLDCSSACVKGMLAVGLLKKKDGPCWRSVCKTSVDQFANEQIPLSALTTPLKTTVRKLRRVAEERGFALLLVTNRSCVVTPFIERTEAPRLRQRFLELQDLAARRKAAKLESKTEVDRLQEYFAGLRESGNLLPRRAKSPNKRAIAILSDVSRNSFYSNAAIAALLVAYDEEDRDRYQIEKRDDISILKDFLESAQRNDVAIPARPCGRPHKSHIAQEAGVDRSIFYKSPAADALVNKYFGGGGR